MEKNKQIKQLLSKIDSKIRSWRVFFLPKVYKSFHRILRVTLCYWIMPILTLIAILLMFKSSDEPLLDSLYNTSFESMFTRFSLGNSIIFDLSLAFLASVIFFIINIWLPKAFKRAYLRRHLINQLKNFKRQCIEIFFDAMDEYHDYDLIERLTQEKVFKKYFKQESSKYAGGLWYDVINGFDEDKYIELLHVFESFAGEIGLIWGQIEILDDEIFNGLRWMQTFAADIRSMIDKEELIGYDNEKYIFRELWEIFTGWDFISGQKKVSFITRVVKKI